MVTTAERTNGQMVKSNQELTKAEQKPLTISQSFEQKVRRQFEAEMGSAINWTPLQATLAQHLYVKIDRSLAELEIKRSSDSYKKDNPLIVWDNVNMVKLTIDAVARIALELDATLNNHIHIIPYLNKRTGKYDVDLRIGYEGNDAIHRKFSPWHIKKIVYKLVHDDDTFDIVENEHGGEKPEYKRGNHFQPGEVIGGYGHVQCEDPSLDRVFAVEYREFEKAEKASKGVEFWGGIQTRWENRQKVEGEYDDKFRKEMQYKTVVTRVCKSIPLDTSKIHNALQTIINEAQMDYIEAEVANEAAQFANQETLYLPSANPETADEESGEGSQGFSDEEKQRIIEQESKVPKPTF